MKAIFFIHTDGLRNMKHEVVGKILADCRTRSKMTQKKAALEIGSINAQFVSNIERGVCPAPKWLLKRLIKVYKIREKEIDLIVETLTFCFLDNLCSEIGIKKKSYILRPNKSLFDKGRA